MHEEEFCYAKNMDVIAFIKQISLLLYIVVVATTMVVVMMENRQPMKTVAWLMILMFLPVVGMVLYFFFGQNIRKERYINRHRLQPFLRPRLRKGSKGEARQEIVPQQHARIMQLFANQDDALPVADNEVETYTCGNEFFPALLQAIREARHHVHLCTYIFLDDALGQQVADALMAKAREGVEVRVIYDDVGSWRVSSSFFRRMQDAGVEVHAFMPVHFPALTRKINYRNHRKICVVDGHTGFIGGMNIAQRYMDGTPTMGAWRDTHLRVKGGCVATLQRIFFEDLYFVSHTLPDTSAYYPTVVPTAGGASCVAQVVTSSPTSAWHNIMQGYVRILLEARHYVYMETPYFLPTEPVLVAMRTAALSGVDVRLMLPYRGDSRIAEWASRSFLPDVIKAGVKVYLYQGGFLHSKLLVSDDSICTCGSTNIDFRSFENNFEANIFFYGKDVARRMKHIYLEDEQRSVRINHWLRKRRLPFVERFLQSLFRLFSPML